MRLFLVTDIHFGTDTNYPDIGGPGYVNNFGMAFSDALPALRGQIASCDAVVNLGDLIHDGANADEDAAATRAASALCAGDAPVFHVPGNHDLRHLSREAWARAVGAPAARYSFDAGGWHHVVLDSVRIVPRSPAVVPADQLAWLRADLMATALPTVVYSHYPLDDQDMSGNYYFRDHPDRAVVSNRAEVRAVLEGSGKVVAVFSGHTHFPAESALGAIRYFTVPSFAENDGQGSPARSYAIATLEDWKADVEVRRVSGR